MTEVTAPGTSTGRLSLPARLLGIIVSPRETYADVAASPRILGALLVTVALSTAVTFWFQTTEIGQKAVLEQTEQSLRSVEELSGQPMSDEQYDQAVERQLRFGAYISGGAVLVMTPILIAILAGVFLGVFNGILGGNAQYKQTFAIVTHSSVIWTLAAVFGVAVALMGGELGSASKLRVFAPMLESGFLFHLLGYIDLFWLWGLANLAVGLGVLYRRPTPGIAGTLIGVYLVCGILYAVVRSMAGV